MKKLIVFPSWVLVRIVLFFAKRTHPWYGRKFTLSDWANGATKLTEEFSLFFWVAIPTLIYLIYNLSQQI